MAKERPKLVDVEKANLFRDIFPYTEFPRVVFDEQSVEYDIPGPKGGGIVQRARLRVS